MIYAEIRYKPTFMGEEIQIWYSRMKINSDLSAATQMLTKYFLTDDNKIAIEDDVTEEAIEIFKCPEAKKSGSCCCSQQLIPFGLLKEKFFK